MCDSEDVKFTLKVMINKLKMKVLYAEAESDFADVLLSFLTLPLGTIVRIFRKHYGDEAPVFGSLTTLYNGLLNLDSDHLCTESGKQMLLNPRKSLKNERCKLKLNVDDTPLTMSFKCAGMDCGLNKSPNMGLYYNTTKCDCGKSALSKKSIIADPKAIDADDDDCGVYTKSKASFVITDDLQIFPSETGYAIHIFRSLGITCTDCTELRNVTLGFNEVMDLLRGSLLSPTPLTDLILNKRKLDHVMDVNMKCGNLQGDQTRKQTFEGKKKVVIVKVIFQESTKKILCAESDGNFVEFLFSLLTIPLGAIEHLLCNSTTLKNIDNLYRTLTKINGDKYLKKDIKSMLLEPKLPQGYISETKILPLVEESYVYMRGDVSVSSVKSPKGDGNYVKGPKMYMITDDLTVTPLCTASSISIIDQLKVVLSDVKEMELVIGLKEALSILKASLTSASALTNGLLNYTSMKQPKLERWGWL